jgi:hypothetical protein
LTQKKVILIINQRITWITTCTWWVTIQSNIEMF